MTRYLPVFLGVVLIVGLTIPQINMTDRLSGSNVSAEQRAELLRKVPVKIGDWIGEDKTTDEKVRETAGAIGAVSRTYRNSRTGEVVDLWLIVGHAREVSAHTPDICYPAAGFAAQARENSMFPIPINDGSGTTMPFWTNTFLKEDHRGQQLIRVFWSWHNFERQKEDGRVVWTASKNARLDFGNTRALYKMYFTSAMKDRKETAEASAAVRFARDFLPEVNKALGDIYNTSSEGSSTANLAAEPSAPQSKSEEVKPAETPTNAQTTSERSTAGPEGAEKDLFGSSSTPPATGASEKTAVEPRATAPAANTNP